ncbi:phage portal protein [Enterococcus faecalis]|uniref:phage portal protein n=1 Tax=Enterococcus faecalis TaxID=1351 RepID=UPI001A972930|nr:phage portal protein [Enterococcus faecalis]MBO1106091.1 phage portal protein [Enterococcus faecalis]
MSLFDLLKSTSAKNRAIQEMLDFEFISEVSTRAYLKRLALDSVLNFVARTMSTMQIQIRDGTKSEWEYLLNVRPNKDMSANDFWQRFFYTLLKNNEVLVIVSDDDQLLIADSFYRNEYALYEDVFEGVTVKGYTYQRNFKMSDVIYLQYNNDKLEKFTDGLFNDYGELFGRIVEVAMRNNQIRASVSIDQTGSYGDKKDENGRSTQEKLQKFVNKIYKSFKTNSVAIVPKLKGFDYEEYTNKTSSSNQSLEELEQLKKTLINDVCRAIGVPSALIHGEMADLEFNLKAYQKLCITQLKDKLQSELNNKILEKSEYKNGQRIVIENVLKRDPYEEAVKIDKLIASGVFTPNQVLRDFEYDESDEPFMNEHHITKNYEKMKGGEEENDSENQD